VRADVDPAIDLSQYWFPNVDIGAYFFPAEVIPSITPIIDQQ
jgi:hypothetical protein